MLLTRGVADPTRAARPLPRAMIVLALLAAGYVVAREFPALPSGVALGLAGVAAALGGLAKGWACRGVMGAACVLFGYGYFTLRVMEAPAPWFAGRSELVRVEGVVLDTPRIERRERSVMAPFGSDGSRVRFDLRLTGVVVGDEVRRASGKVGVVVAEVKEGEARPRAGERVRVMGRLEAVEGKRNPGERDGRLWAAQEGRIGTVRLPRMELIGPALGEGTVLGRAESAWLAFRASMSERAHEILLGATPSPAKADVGGTWHGSASSEGRALLGALILGDEDRALREVRSSFNRLGLTHVLTISGFHLTVMCGVVMVVLRLGGDLGRWEAVIASSLILAYLAILPFNAPVWRSGLMVLGLIAADGLGRRHDRLAVLSWIAVAILLYRPMEAWSIGFQLSFGLVALLVWLGEFTHGRLFGVRLRGVVRGPEGVGSWVRDSFTRLVSTSLLCGIVATPVVAYHTGLVSPAAVLSSILMVPPITGVLIAGYIVLLLGVVAPPLAGVASQALGAMAEWLAWAVRWMDSVPGTSVDVPRISLGLALAATGMAVYWFVRGRWRDGAGWAMLAVVTGWTIGEFRWSGALAHDVLVRVDTLAVGDGTCHLIRSGREAMLWDCGSLTPGVGERLVPWAVRALGPGAVPAVLVTHPNLDHFNGVLDAAGPLGVRRVITGEAVARRAEERPASAEAFLLGELRRRGVEVAVVTAGDWIDLGDVRLDFLSPARGAAWGTDNDASLVARVVPRASAGRGGGEHEALVLLTGDIQGEAIAAIGRDHPRLRAKVVEVPHHGSVREEAVRFVMGLGPRVVLQSTGPGRAGLAEWGPVRDQAAFYCTAEDGAAWVEVLRDGRVRSGAVRR
jgi:competence protein ComEC